MTTAVKVLDELDGPGVSLADLVRRRIDVAYAGNASEFSRAMGMNQQYVQNLLSGRTRVPERPQRDKLAAELGLRSVDFYVLAKEIDPDDVDAGMLSSAAPLTTNEMEVALALRDLSPSQQTMIRNLVSELLGEPIAPFSEWMRRLGIDAAGS